MMVILSKKEYNDLLERAGNVDIAAEKKLEELRKDLRIKIYNLAKSCHSRGKFEQFFTELNELLSHL